MKFTSLIATAIAGFIAVSSPSFAGPVNTSSGIVTVDGKPAAALAAHGFDVVSYFTDGAPAQGDAKHAVIHGNAVYRFASQKHKDMFEAAPEKYLPAYGGYCAYGVSVGAKFDGDPRYWKIVDNKLYLNLDQDIADLFNADISGAIDKADANWPGLVDKDPS